MSSLKTKKRIERNISENDPQSSTQPKNARKNISKEKYSFPKLPKKFLNITKYSVNEKNIMMEDHINMHHIVSNHFDFWIEIMEFKIKCEEYILDNQFRNISKINEACSIISLITKIQKKYLLEYQDFRKSTGEFTGSISSIKCCAGYAHGWDLINRIFSLESLIFTNLYYDTRKKYISKTQLDTDEISILMHKNVSLLIFSKKPIHQWSAKMVQLQLKVISLKWNHIKGLATNGVLRSSLFKLLHLCQLRLYVLIENGVLDPELQKPFEGLQEGIMSENFKGKIICTPQNNCGMNSVTSKNSWIVNLILSMSRLLTKLQNTLYLIDKIIPLSCVVPASRMLQRKTKESVKLYQKFTNFDQIITKEAEEMLDTGQMQKVLSWSICPSIIGIDVLSRSSDIYGSASQDDFDFWSKSRNIAPTGIGIWMDSYLQEQKKDYILYSSLTDILYDIKDLTILNTFDIFSKKDGRNDMGFLRKFVIRIEHLQNCYDLVFKDMHDYNIPLIVKVGADYVSLISKKKIYIACDSASQSIIMWAELLKRVNQWKIRDINLRVIYKNLFKINHLSGADD